MIYPLAPTEQIDCHYRTADQKTCPNIATITLLPDISGSYRMQLCTAHAQQLASALARRLMVSPTNLDALRAEAQARQQHIEELVRRAQCMVNGLMQDPTKPDFAAYVELWNVLRQTQMEVTRGLKLVPEWLPGAPAQ